MEDRELVIKLPEDLCNKIYSDAEIMIYGGMRHSGKTLLATLLRAIRNGTLLPKGHGDLIDKNELLTVTECKEDGTERCYVPYVHIEEAETIIEAESEE